MRIALDAMGGDHGSGVVVEGARLALEKYPAILELILVGDEAELKSSLSRAQLTDPRVRIVHASEVLTMEDKPVEGLRRKKDCSILKAIDLVRDKQADAVISLGNTGGLVAASTIRLRLLPGIDRPAIATVIPTPQNEFVLLDSGANPECKPIHLAHFAIMGSVYSRSVLGYDNPRVGLMSNGTEDNKGTELTREAMKLCRTMKLNFIGHVEGHDLFHNKVDVVVCDGFVGNIVLKTLEGFAKELMAWMKVELMRNPKRQLGALLARNGLRTIGRRMDPDAYGGAPLLGLNGNVLKAHGSAKEKAIMNAIRVTTEALAHQITQTIQREVAEAETAMLAARPVATAS